MILVLLQQGKGAEVGAVFGGSSQTVFGASGAGNVLTKQTSALAAVFFATSLFLAYTSSPGDGQHFRAAPVVCRRALMPVKPAPTSRRIRCRRRLAPPSSDPGAGASTLAI